MSSLGRQGDSLKRRQAALRFLMNEPQAVNVSWVYAESSCTLADLQELAERELILLQETEIFRDPLQHIDEATLQNPSPLDLTPDQQKVWDEIQDGFRTQAEGQALSPYLLHGVTGSGKTEIYLRATAEAIRRGKQVDHPCPRDFAHPADGAPLPGAVPRAGGTRPQQTLRWRTL